MDYGEGTPPVSDTPASHDPPQFVDDPNYVGPDRRRTDPLQIAIESAVQKVQTQPGKLSEVSNVRDLMIRGAALALLVVVVINQFILSGKINDSEKRQGTFRNTVTCFIAEISSPTPESDRNDILAKCGLLKAPE